ncbi:MAG: hypothetical protein PHV18_05015 [Lachnospiraceae bacterium]|nr:hypothetical protein [Lachnospiraceae bacterium]
MTSIQKGIIIRAVRIRVGRGGDATEVIASYTKLSEDERMSILKTIEKKG